MLPRRLCSALCALAVTAAVSALAAPTAGATHEEAVTTAVEPTAGGTYVVTLDAPPVATARDATARDADTRDHRERLHARQDRVLAQVGDPEVLYRYTTTLNGFAADLSAAQVKRLRAMPEVAAVEANELEHLATTDATRFLDLDGAEGVWARHGGPHEAGADVVVGVVDSGIWPENPSFADLPASAATAQLRGFDGGCQPGQAWRKRACGNKVVSARYFVRGFGVDRLAESDYRSPRDARGHGTHTAATIAGNHDVRARIAGEAVGTVSGVAPAARLAVYKACWTAPNPADDGCATADTVKAIDQAVADGVDVLSYSISGSRTSRTDAVQRALGNAAAAGVVVVAPAGNTGPSAGSVGHLSPRVTTVGAATHQVAQGAVVLGDGAAAGGTAVVGAMASDRRVPETRLVLAEDVAAPAASDRSARLCFPGALDARRVAGAVVVCQRGVVARLDKSTAVRRAGGAGMVLTNSTSSTSNTEDADYHAVPTVHVDRAEGELVRSYAERAGRQAAVTLDPEAADATTAPRVAEFSARGPSGSPGGWPLKPDLVAPGVGVVAAVAPPANGDRRWDAYSGTSVAAAHVAGLAALVVGERPDWSPAAVKSALMTTAYDVDGPHDPLTQGAGHVDPTAVLDPGLVYAAGSEEPGRRNLASIAVGDLVGRASVERTVTNVGPLTETYTASVEGLGGVDAAVLPDTLTLSPGESATFRVRLSADEQAEYGELAQGLLTWTGSHGHTVRSPVAARPQTVRVPRIVRGSGESGSVRVEARSGMVGNLDVSAYGLAGSTPRPVHLAPAPYDPQVRGAGTSASTYSVSEDAVAARFEVRGDDREDDLDLYVYREGSLVASATSPGHAEQVTLESPAAGTYEVYVHAVAAADGVTAEGTFTGWVVPGEVSDDLAVTPNPVDARAAEPFALTAAWSGLDTDRRWFGVLAYDSSEALTYVSIN